MSTENENENMSDTNSEHETDSETEQEIEAMYVISVDGVPFFYANNQQCAVDKMRDNRIYTRRYHPSRKCYLSYHIDSESIDLIGWNTYAIVNVDRVLHRFRVDKVLNVSSDESEEDEHTIDEDESDIEVSQLPSTRVGISSWFW